MNQTNTMDTKHSTSNTMSKEAIEFGEWLSRVAVPALLRSRRSLSERRARALTLRSNMEVDDIVVATSDYTASADDEVSLKAGDIVEVLDTKASAGSKYRGRVYRYENHFFQTRGGSLDYVFSVPTYKMYYY